jgi:phosphatidylinositol alpha-1,6-mannosyltransferase
MLVPSRAVLHAIQDAAAAHDTDRILFGTPWPLVLLGSALERRGLRYAVTVHGAETIIPGALPLLRKRMAGALARAELLLPVSDFTKEKLTTLLLGTGHALPRMELLRPHIDLDRFTPRARSDETRRRLGVSPEEKMLLCFGRLVRRKGVHRLVAAYPELARRTPGTVIVAAGTGPEEARLRRLVDRTGARVVLAGRIAEGEAASVYASADVFVLPVRDRWRGLEVEGLGVVLLEAAASGVACITGRSGGTPEAVLDGVTGLVVDAGDRRSLVDAVAALLEDPDRARRMGAAGRRHVERHFSGRVPQALLDWLSP